MHGRILHYVNRVKSFHVVSVAADTVECMSSEMKGQNFHRNEREEFEDPELMLLWADSSQIFQI